MVWEFLSDPEKQKTLGWIGGGCAVVVSALWNAFLTLRKKPPSKPPGPTSAANAKDGIAAGGNLTIAGNVTFDRSRGKAWPMALGLAGLCALAYAAFLAPSGDCIVDGIKAGGDIQAGNITITGGSGDVDC